MKTLAEIVNNMANTRQEFGGLGAVCDTRCSCDESIGVV